MTTFAFLAGRLLAVLAAATMVYLFGAFCAWDMNPGGWSAIWRYLVGFSALVAVLSVWS